MFFEKVNQLIRIFFWEDVITNAHFRRSDSVEIKTTAAEWVVLPADVAIQRCPMFAVSTRWVAFQPIDSLLHSLFAHLQRMDTQPRMGDCAESFVLVNERDRALERIEPNWLIATTLVLESTTMEHRSLSTLCKQKRCLGQIGGSTGETTIQEKPPNTRQLAEDLDNDPLFFPLFQSTESHNQHAKAFPEWSCTS